MKTRQEHPQIRYCSLYLAVQHALQGTVYLVGKPDNEYCLVEDIAAAQDLPRNFLGKIFQTLAHKGLVVSQRGPGGGYSLARPANQILVSEIIDAVQEPVLERGRCLLGFRGYGKDRFCLAHKAVAQADSLIAEVLRHTTLADLANDSGGI